MKTLRPCLSFVLVILAAIAALGATQLAADEVVYEDDFSNVKGERMTLANGTAKAGSADGTRQVFIFMSDSVVGGELSMTALESNETMGQDGKPGVLSLSYDSVPSSTDYSGFVYQGRNQDEIKLPFKGKVGEEQLKQVQVSFRYKAVNANQAHVGATYNCRFEVDVNDPYEHRVDFGELKATGKWQTFSATLSQGDNTSVFLGAMNDSPGAACKLVWGQEGEVSNYDEGDTLLIDDIKISLIQ
jgi:hypothetical protein